MSEITRCVNCGKENCKPDECKPVVEKTMELVVAESTELEMYKDYLRFMPVEAIAKKYGIPQSTAYHLVKTKQWKRRREQAIDKAYKSIDRNYKASLVELFGFIQHDYRLLRERCMREAREMNKDERQYVLNLIDRMCKEARLNEGKPTEISEGNHKVVHEVILPPGVKRFGVIPPASNVIEVEAKPVEKTDAVEDDGDPDEI